MRSRGARVALIVVLVLAPVIALAIVMTASSGGDDGEDTAYQELLERRAARDATPDLPEAPSVSPSTTAPEATPDATDQAEADEPAGERRAGGATRLRIDRLQVDAPLIAMNIDSNGVMEAPHEPELVAWYDFTSRPGSGSGNAVFAGHRDWRDHGPAVFWDLHELEPGDAVELELSDGSNLRYVVTAVHSYPIEALDMREILAPTSHESITLITCAGEYAEGDYTERHVVRAVLED